MINKIKRIYIITHSKVNRLFIINLFIISGWIFHKGFNSNLKTTYQIDKKFKYKEYPIIIANSDGYLAMAADESYYIDREYVKLDSIIDFDKILKFILMNKSL